MTSFKPIPENAAVAQFDTQITGQAEADEFPFCKQALVARGLEFLKLTLLLHAT
jgi:hypothetical protein